MSCATLKMSKTKQGLTQVVIRLDYKTKAMTFQARMKQPPWMIAAREIPRQTPLMIKTTATPALHLITPAMYSIKWRPFYLRAKK